MSNFVANSPATAVAGQSDPVLVPVPPFVAEKHGSYVTKVANDTSSFEFVVSQHFRMSGVYWGLTALCILGVDIKKEMDMATLLDWLMSCQDTATGGYGVVNPT